MIPLIIEPGHVTPQWKIPGGTKKFGETPAQTAIRELEEETGLIVAINDLKLVQRLNLRGHDRYLYKVEILSFADLKEMGTEREIVRIFTIKEIQIMDDLLIQHRKLLIDMGLIT